MNKSSAPWPDDVSEFEACGITAIPGVRVAAPRPEVALVTMECQRIHSLDLTTTHLLVGEVVLYHVDDAVIRVDARGHQVADITVLDAIGRLGGRDYVRVTEMFTLSRPRMDGT